ncbi:MAG: isopentenyl-diphosphate Delta-isomerase [Hyphomicrobium sp.]|nr:isopentenyl-diphosphate Delta-isomerase [Hyphomicrobium sp.]
MDDTTEHVILVDEQDREVGTAGKLDAHVRGQLHRAFSIIVWNTMGEMLLQKRALSKYHSGGLWTNACCGHPRPGEGVAAAARRRLREELGFECRLDEVGTITYRAGLDRGMTENEYVHVFHGFFDGDPSPDPNEVSETRWVGAAMLDQDMDRTPDAFTVWFVKYMRAGWPLAARPAA